MADLKQNTTYGDPTEISSALGRSLNKPSVSLPKVMPETQVPSQPSTPSLPKFSGGGSDIYGQWKSNYKETVPFMGSTNYEQGGTHEGVDIAMPSGTPVQSLTAGTVVESRTGQGRDPSKPSFGNYVVVKTPEGKFVRYSHLSQAWKPVNSSVEIGDVIGDSGNSGSTYSTTGGDGSHLDLRVWEVYQGMKKYLDPSSYFTN